MPSGPKTSESLLPTWAKKWEAPAAAMNTAMEGRRTIWKFGNVEPDRASFELRVGKRKVDIEPRPLEVLFVLLESAGQLVTKDDLLERDWHGRLVSEVTIANTVSNLRRSLGPEELSRQALVCQYGLIYDPRSRIRPR